jgi:transcriptional regulator with PAS, ATPase and Fis domain
MARIVADRDDDNFKRAVAREQGSRRAERRVGGPARPSPLSREEVTEEVADARSRYIVGENGEAMTDWTTGFPGAVTVCDRRGVITYMNDKSAKTFEADGGLALVGTNLLDCHPEPSRSRVADLLANPRVNAYTIEKRGVRKLIYQAPWFRDGIVQGLVELSLEIPDAMPHFIREG